MIMLMYFVVNLWFVWLKVYILIYIFLYYFFLKEKYNVDVNKYVYIVLEEKCDRCNVW